MLDSCWRLFEEIKSRKTLIGLLQLRKIVRISLKFRQLVSQVERDHSFETPPCRHEIMTGVVQGGKEPEDCGFGWFVAEFDVMFRGVVETALCSGQVALIQKALAELAIGHGESFFIPDDPVIVEGQCKRRDRLLPLSFTRLLQRQIVMENAERAIVF
jgi:hypothetical protein